MARFDPARPDFAPYGLTCVKWTPGLMRRPDRHNEIELNLLENGSVTYLLGGKRVTVASRQLVVFWAAIPHQVIELSTQGEYHVATLPLPWFLQCRFPADFVSQILHARMLKELVADRGTEDLSMLERWRQDLQSRDAIDSRPMLLEAEARLLRLANGTPSSPSRQPGARSLTKAEEMACYIAIHYQEALTVNDIAKSVGLHANYAMNVFRHGFGSTLNQYLCQHRISHAQRLLITTDRQILDVALDAGFGSTSRFNEAFSKSCGCSPREYRRRHQS